jgi:hypothetical protein
LTMKHSVSTLKDSISWLLYRQLVGAKNVPIGNNRWVLQVPRPHSCPECCEMIICSRSGQSCKLCFLFQRIVIKKDQ